MLAILGMTVFVGLVAGAYPAAYLSRISPLAALTQVRRSWRGGLSLRRTLVLVQLCISIGVVACTVIMIAQMRYLQDKPLGFDKDNRLIVTLRGFDVLRQLGTIKNELRATRNVVDVTAIGSVPGTAYNINMTPVENNEGGYERVEVHRVMIGMNFVESMKLTLLEGRGFSEDIKTDVHEAALVNESFVRRMGWQSAIGKHLQIGPDVARVVGVVKDFHYASLHNEIGPLLMLPVDEDPNSIPEDQRSVATTSVIVVLTGDDLRNTVASVRDVISRFDPNFYFEPIFLGDRLQELYESEARLTKLTGMFAILCILISLMGLYGLTLFATEQRTKEIGIRKVLGASDVQIIVPFCGYLLVLVGVAAVPASLLSYYAMNAWLRRFAYHDRIHALAFIGSTLLVGLVTIATAVWQSSRAARSNPIESLRYE
jgi:putative ABC transport system permease protein